MKNLYSRLTKLNNVVHRIYEYTQKPDKQERILLVGGNGPDRATWEKIAQYEKDHQKSNEPNTEALEIMFTLPNSLINREGEIKVIIEQFAKRLLGDRHPYAYAVHEKAKGSENENLHVHLIFSEREILREKQTPKTYARDIWQDPITHKLTKAGVGELVHKKGEIQKDSEGNIKYKELPLSTKDKKFKKSEFVFFKDKILKDVFSEHGFEYGIGAEDKIHIHKKHITKNLDKTNYELYKQKKSFNDSADEYNNSVDSLLEINPRFRSQLEEHRTNLFKTARENKLNLVDVIKQFTQNIIKTIEKQLNKSSFNDWMNNINSFDYSDDGKNNKHEL